MAGKVTLITGPMCAGKTTELRRLAENHARCDMPVVLIRFLSDERDGSTGAGTPSLFTHRGDWGIDPGIAGHFRSVRAVSLTEVDLSGDERFVAIDEGQFFKDLAPAVRRWAEMGVSVVISALNGKADRSPWASVSEVYPEADNVITVTAVCGVCKRPDREAIFSLRLPGASAPDADGVAIGGKEDYVPACRECSKCPGKIEERQADSPGGSGRKSP
jgi:thymidine kinase